MRHHDEHAAHVLRSSISHAWSSTCHAMRRATYRGGHLFSPPCGPPADARIASRIALRVAATAAASPRLGVRSLSPSLGVYADSASMVWSAILSRSRPPPRGPLRSSAGAFEITLSKTFHEAASRAQMRSASAAESPLVSLDAGMPGAPKSVVALPVTRSTTLNCAAVGKSMRAVLGTIP